MGCEKGKGTTIYLPEDEADEILEDLEEYKDSKRDSNYEAIKKALRGGDE